MGRAEKLQRAVDHLVSVVMELREVEKGDDSGLCLGDLIKRERDAWGLSLMDLARRCGVSKAHVWEMEASRSINPSAELVGALAEALVIPPIQVLNAALTSQRICRLKQPPPATPAPLGREGKEDGSSRST